MAAQGPLIVDLGPKQEAITREKIAEMLKWQPRRNRLATEWPDLLKAPNKAGGDWSIVIPFNETISNAFYQLCHVETIGFRKAKSGQTYYTFLRGSEEAHLDRVREWHKTIGRFVALRDCLCLSFALDYERENGDPNKPQTAIGKLRAAAKTYGAAPTKATFAAADKLANACIEFATAVPCYQEVDCIVAMPPSDPDAKYSLPRQIAETLSNEFQKPDLSAHIKTRAKRRGMKDTALAEKLDAISDTIECDEKIFVGKDVLLVDDLYQSGVSLNYAAMQLLNAGAKRVYGLCCEKTCRNDDNKGAAQAQ